MPSCLVLITYQLTCSHIVSVLDAWAKTDREDSTERALRLLREMPAAGILPDQCSYNTVLNAFARQGSAVSVKEAEELFQECLSMTQNGDSTISDMEYNVMINVYGKSNDAEGAEKAEALLRLMQENGVEPTIISYNSCIDAYAR